MKIHDIVKRDEAIYEIKGITSGDFPYLLRNISNVIGDTYIRGFAMNSDLEIDRQFFNKYVVEYLGSKENYPELFI